MIHHSTPAAKAAIELVDQIGIKAMFNLVHSNCLILLQKVKSIIIHVRLRRVIILQSLSICDSVGYLRKAGLKWRWKFSLLGINFNRKYYLFFPQMSLSMLRSRVTFPTAPQRKSSSQTSSVTLVTVTTQPQGSSRRHVTERISLRSCL